MSRNIGTQNLGDKGIRILYMCSILLLLPLLILIIFLITNSRAAINESINIQGKFTNLDGTNITSSNATCIVAGASNDTCDFQFSLYDASSGGNLLWQETKSNVELENYDGVFSQDLDFSTNYQGLYDSTIFESDGLYLQISFDGNGDGDFTDGVGIDETFSTRSQFNAVPYAFHAGSADTLGGIGPTGFVRFAPSSAQVDATTNSSIFINKTGASGNILQLQKNATDVFVVDNAGKVGIGTATPMDKLHVYGNEPLDGVSIRVENDSDSTGAVTEVYLENDINGYGGLIIGGSGLNSTTYGAFANRLSLQSGVGNEVLGGISIASRSSTGDIRLYTGGVTSANERMRIQADGKVGIGTTSPGNILEVAGGISATGTTGFISSPYQIVAPKGITNIGTGTLTSVGTTATGTNPQAVAVDPTGRFAYVVNYNSATVQAYTINQSTGLLTSVGTTATGSAPYSVAVDPTGRFAYVANYGSNTVQTYTINQYTGALTSVGTTATGSVPTSVAVDKTGRFAYVANYSSNTVQAYTINQSTGLLTSVGTTATGTLPRSVVVDPTGRFAYVANGGSSNTVQTYTINQSTGFLTSVGTTATGSAPLSVSVDPAGRFAYVANGGSNTVQAYAINQSTGLLTSVGTTGTASTPYSVAVDPTGLFAYVANWGSNNVQAYAINQSTGLLTLVGTTATGSVPTSVAVAPTGRFAYVANFGSATVQSYTINNFSAGSGYFASNVGIGTSAPGVRLYVADTSIDGNLFRLVDSDGTCNVDPEAGGSSFVCTSDAALKYDVVDSGNILSQLMGIDIRQYKMIVNDETHKYGVIAQELALVAPEKVSMGDDGYLMVEQYSSWELIKGMQEQQAQIEGLKTDVLGINTDIANLGTDVTNINTEVSDLDTRLSTLEAQTVVDNDLLPSTTDTYDVGSLTERWNNTYTKEVHTETIVIEKEASTDSFSVNNSRDVFIEGNGTLDNTGGAMGNITEGTALLSLIGDKLDLNNDGVADGNKLCTNSLTNPTIIAVDDDSDCTNGALGLVLLGIVDGSEITEVGANWTFVDTDLDTLLDEGEDIYQDYSPNNVYSGGFRSGNIDPLASNAYNLGSESNYWKGVYADTIYGKNTAVSNFDLAEEYQAVDKTIEAGDVVAPYTNVTDEEYRDEAILIDRTEGKYQRNVMGVISTEPGVVLAHWDEQDNVKDSMRPVALSGRVPVKVTVENGEIKKGDYLVPSSKPGYAMKACGTKYCEAGMVVGMALEDFGVDSSGDTVEVAKDLEIKTEELTTAIEEIKEVVNTYEEQVQVENMEDIVEVLTNEPEVEIGEGRVMMFVGLMYYMGETTNEEVGNIEMNDATLAESLVLEGNTESSALDIQGILGGNNNVSAYLNDAYFAGDIVVGGDILVEGDITIKGHVEFSEDSVGRAVIQKGDSEVEIKFTNEYEFSPIVNATPLEFLEGAYRVTEITKYGFKIEIQELQVENIEFNWFAFMGSSNYNVFLSEGNGEESEELLIEDVEEEITESENGTVSDETEDTPETVTVPEETPTPTIEPEPTLPIETVEESPIVVEEQPVVESPSNSDQGDSPSNQELVIVE